MAFLWMPDPAHGMTLSPTEAWSRRVRRVGGFIQVAFAGFWLIRGSLAIGGSAADVLIIAAAVLVLAVSWYGVKVTSGVARRPHGREAQRIERAVTLWTVVELAAAFALPILVASAGHSDWVLPSIAVTIGPLLLWLDHRLDVPRYRPVGWALTIGPFVLVLLLSGTALTSTTGIAAGLLLLSAARAGFHDLAEIRSATGRTGLGTPASETATLST